MRNTAGRAVILLASVILICFSISLAGPAGQFLFHQEWPSGPVSQGSSRFAGGAGTAANPYQISTVTQLQWMGNLSNLNKHFIIINNIDASATASWNGGDGFVPVGDNTNSFTGTLDGNDYSISNLTIDPTASYVGLFGKVDNTGICIENVVLKDCSIGGATNTGGIAGWLEKGLIQNCTVDGDVSTNDNYIGGIVGYNKGTISNCSSSASVSGFYSIGGIAGSNQVDSIIDCKNYGTVSGTGNLGGIAGYVEKGIIRNCTNFVTMTGPIGKVGGIAGYSNEGTISNCINMGNVSSTNEAGGIVGNFQSDGVVRNSTNYGTISGSGNSIGGIVGNSANYLQVYNCSNEGDVTASVTWAGGIIGRSANGILVSNCTNHANITVPATGFQDGGGILGVSTGSGTVSNCINYGKINGHITGGIVGDAYTLRISECINFGNLTGDYAGGIGSNSDGTIFYECTNYGNIQGGVDDLNGGIVSLMYKSDAINCTNFGNLTGQYDLGGIAGSANPGTIQNCTNFGTVNATYSGGGYAQSIGGIAVLTNNAAVWNCSNYGRVIGGKWEIGGIVAKPSRTYLVNCSNYNTVEGESYVGGIYARGSNWFNITDCYNYGNITGSGDYVGGLGGYSIYPMRINNSHNSGNVTGLNHVGGITGLEQYGNVTNCTNTGSVSVSELYAGGISGNAKAGFTFNCVNYGNVSGASNYVGGIAGSGTVAHEFVNNINYGAVSAGGDQAGGISGRNNLGIIANCTNYGKTTSQGDQTGGITGINNGGLVDVTNFGRVVSSGDLTGGIAGQNNAGSILRGTNIGPVQGKMFTGGVAGYNPADSFIHKSISFKDVTGTSQTGGFIGSNSGVIENSYSHGGVSGTDEVGGFCGNNTAYINDSYSIGAVSGITLTGGFSGKDSGTVNDCFFDNQTSGMQTSAKGTGKNTTEMMKAATFTGAGWDFSGTWSIMETLTSPYFGDWFGVLYYRPAILTSAIGPATEEVFFSVQITANITEYPCDKAVWYSKTNAPWLSHDNGLLSGTPQNSDVGTQWVEVTVEDIWGNTSTVNFTLQVLNVNDQPQITTTDVTDAYEDVLYSVDYEVQDIDPGPDTMTWALATNSPFLAIDGATGLLYGTPLNGQDGTYWVNVSVSDNAGGGHFTNFTLTAHNVNDDPVITTTDVKTVQEDELYSVDYTATDIDPTADTLTWSLQSNAGFLSIESASGILSGTPDNSHVGSYWVHVIVSDGVGGQGETNFTLNVTNTNDAPVVVTDSLDDAVEDEQYSFTLTASDIDPTGDTLTWTMDTNAGFLFLNGNTGVLNGTPGNEDVGSWWVEVTVSDGNGGLATSNLTLNVINTNDPPVWEDVPAKKLILEIAHVFEFDSNATDVDGDDLTYSISSSPDSQISIDAGTGEISWITEKVEIFTITISVDDGSVSVGYLFLIEVISRNTAPSAKLTSPGKGEEINTLKPTFYWEGSDLDEDKLTYDLYLSKGLSDVENQALSALVASNISVDFYFAEEPLEAGATYYWTIIPHDGVAAGACSSGTWFFQTSLEATVDNNLPEFTSVPLSTAELGKEWVYTPTWLDPDGDDVTITILQSPPGMIYESGKLSWTPTEVGSFEISIQISDGRDTVVQDFNITVSEGSGGGDDDADGGILQKLDWWEILGILIGILLAIIGVIFTAVIARRKLNKLKNLLDEIEKVYEENRSDPKECKSQLEQIRTEAQNMMKNGSLSREDFLVVKDHVTHHLKALKSGEGEETGVEDILAGEVHPDSLEAEVEDGEDLFLEKKLQERGRGTSSADVLLPPEGDEGPAIKDWNLEEGGPAPDDLEAGDKEFLDPTSDGADDPYDMELEGEGPPSDPALPPGIFREDEDLD